MVSTDLWNDNVQDSIVALQLGHKRGIVSQKLEGI